MKALTALRYPGGKSKVVKKILSPFFPVQFNNFYEPFLGGGSVALFISQMYKDKQIFVNDLNKVLINFHKNLKEESEAMVKELLAIRKAFDPLSIERGKELLKEMQQILYDEEEISFRKAVAYYVLNKISFSGLTEHGSLSKLAYQKTFNKTNISKLNLISSFMGNWHFSSEDFSIFMERSGEDDFTFLDPPYMIESSNLYGKNGELHSGFNHFDFLQSVKRLRGKFMITYNDNEWIRESYKEYKIIDAEYRYCMSFETDEEGNKKTRQKNELIITNY